MAKYDITYQCGHDDRVDIVGPEKDRDLKKDWLEGRVCRDCYRAAQNARSAAAAQAQGLPDLSGSEKQIAWAVTIRQQAINAVAELWREREDRRKAAEERASADPQAIDDARKGDAEIEDQWDAFARAQTSAGWWIDHRDLGAFGLVRLLRDDPEGEGR